ncbi:phosphopyruvate hydratase [candidate division CPR3 bacterium GWF2_35_18]|uniref:Enolase n=1 Tax=candidate division CPR3 bacterium GW2011_GWF2_35_18 TaxID=1618350 RepID=A0A0G0BI29_UNCC3|nr:MAG: Enolase [candidate division CPR3 bacterium GW2011_GWF2_35_18]OGB63849.1 MAG: phosphopyruvate hydratase [candidate division CPR3 bacterium GWF2_35_18]OGB65236.1 MAG: phosphopyruvate hydratase [candidate division CPR3 bacterium RIFOXYA2_FULL_35_13]OGB79415.1 MAG: phosphopyruvate hydratase [candidate division CPR3 bacterium RIFOXYB2_FULL_35_8]
MKITAIQAQEIYDSRGYPTIGVRLTLENGIVSFSDYPSGSSYGNHESLELKDGGRRLRGKGVRDAVHIVEKVIAPQIMGMDVENQPEIDAKMIDFDGTPNKKRLGGNAILSVSMAVAKAAALSKRIPLYKYLKTFFPINGLKLPIPLMVFIEGGKHADYSSDFQEYMIAPFAGNNFAEKMEIALEIYYCLKEIVKKRSWSLTVGEEGGFAGKVCSNEEPLEMLVLAIERAGFIPGKDIKIALDLASSEFYKQGKYYLPKDDKVLDTQGMISYCQNLINDYPIFSIEDAIYEDDWEGFQKMTAALGDKIQVVGDDLYTTNPRLLQKGIRSKATNSIVIKLNQVGTVSETVESLKIASENKIQAMVSQRAGETEDSFFADLCVASACGQIKSGAPCRGERIAKYNRLLWIERELGIR